jgi:hypothetical protein
MHFDAALRGVIAYVMMEVRQDKIGAELPVDASQEIPVKRSGDSERIVVG